MLSIDASSRFIDDEVAASSRHSTQHLQGQLLEEDTKGAGFFEQVQPPTQADVPDQIQI